MKRRVMDSQDFETMFLNYASEMSVMITEMEGEASFSYKQFDLDDFLEQCDGIAESINGYCNFFTDYDKDNNDCFGVEFITNTPLDIDPEDYDLDTAEKVGEAKFHITLLPYDVINGLQDYADRRNGYYGGR